MNARMLVVQSFVDDVHFFVSSRLNGVWGVGRGNEKKTRKKCLSLCVTKNASLLFLYLQQY
jgi:hypothetical protein